jgi:protein gp37
VWIGCTVEDQKRADERIPLLWQIPAAIRWLSVEPMLEPIAISTPQVPAAAVRKAHTEGRVIPLGSVQLAVAGNDVCIYDLGGIDWVVCGGESAQTRANTRQFALGWARSLLAECRAGGVKFFMKQLGTRPIFDLLDHPNPPNRTSRYKWHEPEHWPEELRVQEFPEAA